MKMQDGDEQQPDRLAEVDQAPADVVGEDLVRVAQVGVDDRGVLVAGQDGLAVRDRDRVDVDVDDPGARVGPLGDLVHVPLGRYAGPDVEELADAGAGQQPHRPAEKGPVCLADRAGVGLDRGDHPADVLVGQEVVGAAKEVVVDTGDVRALGVDTRWYPVRPARHDIASSHLCPPSPTCARPRRAPFPGRKRHQAARRKPGARRPVCDTFRI
jgi:hypothetical protein